MHVCVLTLYIILVFLFIMRVLRKAACPPLNLKFFLKSTRSSLTLRDFRKPTSPPLPLREGPPLSPSPFPFRVQGMYQPPYWCFFLKSTRPSFIDKAGCIRQFESELSLRSFAQLFPIKEGSTSFSKPFSHGEGWLHSAI